MIIAKIFYWILIGWWLEPIILIRDIKRKKMENAIIKNEYNKIKAEQKKED